MPVRRSALVLVLVFAGLLAAVPAQEKPPISPSVFAAMKWRSIGPHRASRTVAAAGLRAQPYTFYMAPVNGGVWKTTDAGRTWMPVFDDQPTGSIGAWRSRRPTRTWSMSEAARGCSGRTCPTGDGVYKSTDAGRTWTQLGLRDAQQIPRITSIRAAPTECSSPRSAIRTAPTRSVASSARPTAAARSRRCSTRTRTRAATTSTSIPINPDIVYATMWEERQGPWENAAWGGTGGGIFKSTDGGTTWRPLTKRTAERWCRRTSPSACPTRSGFTPRWPTRTNQAAARTAARRASSGATMRARPGCASRATRARPAASAAATCPCRCPDPEEPRHRIIRASTVSWKSTDGGKTWAAYKGAPGGDDYQNGWINPDNPDIMLLAGDQGAVVTLNGGKTWSSWYNQPTAQLYHVAADNAFPYRVCSGQQESGSACVSSRGNDGADHVPRLACRSASMNTATPRRTRSTPTSSTAAEA